MFPISLALLLLSSSTSVYALMAAEWRDKSIYQVVTDRFARNSSVTSTCTPSQQAYCGGSYQALITRLDYIQGMGFDAIWVSPVVTNIAGSTTEGTGYHGYWTQDVATFNSNFGSASDFQALVTALHNRGMYIMVDVVVNHVASTAGSSFLSSSAYSSYPQFSTAGDFHPFCWISDYNNQTNVEQCWLGDTTVALPDIDTEDTTIINYWNSWIKALVTQYSIDGIRVDTVKHVRQSFWPDFNTAAGVYAVGEVLLGTTSYVAAYQNYMDGILHYPLYYQILIAFQSNSGNIAALYSFFIQAAAAFKDTTLLGTFIDNHDQPRFASLTSDVMLNYNAGAVPFVIDGIPIMYYGSEQGFSGGADPANREPMWTSNYDTTGAGYKFAWKMTQARKAAGNYSQAFYTTKAFISSFGTHEIAFAKYPMVALLTNRGSGSGTATFQIPHNASLPEAAQVVDILTCTTWQTDKTGATLVTITNGAPQIILPLAAVGTLCPNGTTKSTTTTSSSDTTPADPVTTPIPKGTGTTTAGASASATASTKASAASPLFSLSSSARVGVLVLALACVSFIF